MAMETLPSASISGFPQQTWPLMFPQPATLELMAASSTAQA
jgi:hypothetical protein